MSSARILCLLNRISHPISAAPIDMLRQAGFQVEVMGFQRLPWFGRPPKWPVTILGHIQRKSYLKRTLTLLKAAPKIRAAIKRSQLVYAYNADMALLACIAGLGLRRPIVFHALYLQPIQVASGWRGKLARTIDRFVVGRCHLLVLTSSGLHHYFRGWLKTRTRILVIEAKIESSRAAAVGKSSRQEKDSVPLLDRPLTIGWFGMLRGQWSLEFLECLSRLSNGRFEILLAGAAAPHLRGFDRFLESGPGIKFLGAFRHPEDLAELYGSVDMVLACLSADIPGRWMQAGRYYEACFFQKPLIVRPGEDARQVEKHQIGVVLDESSPAEAAKTFSAVTSGHWLRWRTNMAALPPNHYLFTDEASQLSRALQEILNS